LRESRYCEASRIAKLKLMSSADARQVTVTRLAFS
jgi:hypothetical protein